MKLLFSLDAKNYPENCPEYVRPSVRGIIIKNGKIALVTQNCGSYSIPGGGIEEGETHLDTLIREVREEAGLVVIPDSVREFGEVLRVEKKIKNNKTVKLVQRNFFYTCDVEDRQVEQDLDESEKVAGYKLEWVFPTEAIKKNQALMAGSNNPLSLERTSRIIELAFGKIYYTQSYLKQLDCTVVSVNKTENATEVKTNRTIFYPECGGQPGDRGKLGDFEVLDTKKDEDGNSVLILNKEDNPQVGHEYNLKLDWPHRYKYMIMHTCQHMTSGLLFSLFNIGTVSVHLGEDYMTIETNQQSINDETIEQLVCALNKAVLDSHKIIYHEMTHEEAEKIGLRRSIKVDTDVRLVEIEGIDTIACGGVHVTNTSEIGLVTYLGQEQIRGHVRLFFSCGEVARASANKNQKILSKLGEKLSCSSDDLVKNISLALEENAVVSAKNQNLEKKLAGYIIDKNNKDGVAVFEESDNINLQSYVHSASSMNDLAMCIVRKDNGKLNWLIFLKGKYEKIEFSVIKEKLFPIIDAKGGGRLPSFQGIGNKTDSQSVKSFLEEFKNLL